MNRAAVLRPCLIASLLPSPGFPQQPPAPPPRDPAEGTQTPPSKTTPGAAQPATTQPSANQPGARATSLDTKPLRWRAVGPANMGGRISDFAVDEKNTYTMYVAVATGGVLKSANNGTTWESIFDKQPVASTGAVAVSQNNPKLVWVGTGEGNSRN